MDDYSRQPALTGVSRRAKLLIGGFVVLWGVVLVVLMFLPSDPTVREQIGIGEARQDGEELVEAISEDLGRWTEEAVELEDSEVPAAPVDEEPSYRLYWLPSVEESCKVTPVRDSAEAVWEFKAFPENSREAFDSVEDLLVGEFGADGNGFDSSWSGRTDRYLKVNLSLDEAEGSLPAVSGRISTECRPL
ncbi:hypothetical protein [Salininema proteolyticum]|uniref:Uncharacterized protein n=1 Tax=Salininema proteolyticum TaxID=1607685 RepID=A0ABV8U3A6_9ACTN